MNVKAVRSRRHAGEVDLHLDVAVADISDVHGSLCRVGAGRRERSHGHRSARMRAAQDEKERGEAYEKLSHDPSNISL